MRWYHGWNVVCICFVFQAVHWGLSSYTFTFWVLPWMKEFGASRSDIMLAPSMAILMMGVFSPVAGWALDRFPARAFVSIGASLFSLSFFLTSQATAVWQIVVVYGLLIAAGEAMAGPMTAQILTTKWFTQRRGLALGISSTGISAGGIVFPPLATALTAAHGWREAQFLLGLVPLLCVVPLAWLSVLDAPRDPRTMAEPKTRSAIVSMSETDRTWTTRDILRDRGFRILAIAIIPPNIAMYGIIQNLGPYAHDLGFDASTSSIFMSVLSISMLAGKVIFGIFADHVQKRYLYWTAMGGLALSLVLFLSGIREFNLIALNSVVVGLAMGAGMPLMGAIVGSRFGPASMGRAMGLLYPFVAFCSIGPVLTGWIRDMTGSYSGAFIAYLIALLPVAILIGFFPEREVVQHGMPVEALTE